MDGPIGRWKTGKAHRADTVLPQSMAKDTRKGRRRFRRYLRGAIQNAFNLGTLAGTTGIVNAVDDVVTEKTWISSVKATWALEDLTQAAGDGPIEVFIAHSDYTLAEIEEWIESTASWDQSDLVGQEVAKRKIRRVGAFGANSASAGNTLVLNDGKPITTKCGWMLMTGQTVNIVAFNAGSSALGTTDPALLTSGHANLWPA